MSFPTGPTRKIIVYCPECFSQRVRFCRRIKLKNGVTLLYDDQRGCAEGDDGRIYHAVCRELPASSGDIEIVGWSAEIKREVIL